MYDSRYDQQPMGIFCFFDQQTIGTKLKAPRRQQIETLCLAAQNNLVLNHSRAAQC